MKESYSLPELARAWSVSIMTLYRMIKAGKLEAFKAGHSWRVSLAERQRIEKKFITT